MQSRALVRLSSGDEDRISRELRLLSTPLLKARRRVARLSLLAVGSLGIVALYQLGLIKHVPEPALPFFDADDVDASGEAYALMSMPDAVLGMVSYSITLALAAADGEDRVTRRPWLPLALFAKVVADSIAGAVLTREQWVKHRAFCCWCLLAAGASVASLPAAAREAHAVLPSAG